MNKTRKSFTLHIRDHKTTSLLLKQGRQRRRRRHALHTVCSGQEKPPAIKREDSQALILVLHEALGSLADDADIILCLFLHLCLCLLFGVILGVVRGSHSSSSSPITLCSVRIQETCVIPMAIGATLRGISGLSTGRRRAAHVQPLFFGSRDHDSS